MQAITADATFFFYAMAVFILGYFWGHRTAAKAARAARETAMQQHHHALLGLDSFKTVISRANTRAGRYIRVTTTVQPARDPGLATPTCCSKGLKLNLHVLLNDSFFFFPCLLY